MRITRRSVLQGMGGMAALHVLGPAAGARAADAATAPRLVFVLLRGGMDGLGAVPAPGDPYWTRARGGLAGPAAGEDGAPRPLDALFALDARLATLHDFYGQGQLVVAHAIALPYRDRSHFDAQNLLESGGHRPFALADGWLGRALAARGGRDERSVGLQPTLPLVLRGNPEATSWSPTTLGDPSPALLAAAARLYRHDPALAGALAQGAGTRRIVSGERAAREADASFVALAAAAGAFLAAPGGARVAVLELGGWDTHNLQSLGFGGFDRSLRQLDAGMRALRARLGATWRHTVVVASTEFGRTVAMNGSAGTDHGTASAAFVMGGAVAGGRVVHDWPGLAPAQLHEGRDLRPTLDLRALWKGVLRDHLLVSEGVLATRVFPGSRAVRPLDGLVRA